MVSDQGRCNEPRKKGIVTHDAKKDESTGSGKEKKIRKEKKELFGPVIKSVAFKSPVEG